MTWFIIAGAVLLYILFPTLRCVVGNLPAVIFYSIKDIYTYHKQKQWNLCRTGELVAYVGLFGKGKTLSAVHRIVGEYHRHNGQKVWCMRRNKPVTQRVHVLSNVSLSIPYEHLVSLEQIVNCAEKNRIYDDENDTLTVTLVLGDEFSVQMNSREFKKNIDPLFLNTLLTCRHHHISLYYTAQRFGHVDALLRQVTSYVGACDKLWRFQRISHYDAWDLEQAQNPKMVQPLRRSCWFVRNKDYDAYDTLACVGNLKKSFEKGDMLTEDEILNLQRNQASDMESVNRPSRKWQRRRKPK